MALVRALPLGHLVNRRSVSQTCPGEQIQPVPAGAGTECGSRVSKTCVVRKLCRFLQTPKSLPVTGPVARSISWVHFRWMERTIVTAELLSRTEALAWRDSEESQLAVLPFLARRPIRRNTRCWAEARRWVQVSEETCSACSSCCGDVLLPVTSSIGPKPDVGVPPKRSGFYSLGRARRPFRQG